MYYSYHSEFNYGSGVSDRYSGFGSTPIENRGGKRNEVVDGALSTLSYVKLLLLFGILRN